MVGGSPRASLWWESRVMGGVGLALNPASTTSPPHTGNAPWPAKMLACSISSKSSTGPAAAGAPAPAAWPSAGEASCSWPLLSIEVCCSCENKAWFPGEANRKAPAASLAASAASCASTTASGPQHGSGCRAGHEQESRGGRQEEGGGGAAATCRQNALAFRPCPSAPHTYLGGQVAGAEPLAGDTPQEPALDDLQATILGLQALLQLQRWAWVELTTEVGELLSQSAQWESPLVNAWPHPLPLQLAAPAQPSPHPHTCMLTVSTMHSPDRAVTS